MQRIEQWPPPELWTAVRISWQIMLDSDQHNPREIIDWVEARPGGRWHLSGWDEWKRLDTHGIDYKRVDGFEFRFERPEDATVFALRWGQHDD